MVDTRNDPSMEDILASIKRIIAEDGAAALNTARAPVQPPPAPTPPPPAVAETPEEDVLELTEEAIAPAPEIVSPDAATASRQSLAALSAAVVQPPAPASVPEGGTTLEALARELLRPMLKDWLDQHLPGLVEELVAREIARITGKGK